uniref:RING-type domain-containing protein n=1 Tax=Astatotilapia calliptera TaxID=8154 RepID=A0A3P8Q1M5_ASTCA
MEKRMDEENISCSICLDLLKDPVTIPCGHSYCMNCIKTHFDEEDRKGIHSCPQCSKTFTPRPVLEKNTMLAGFVDAGVVHVTHHSCFYIVCCQY